MLTRRMILPAMAISLAACSSTVEPVSEPQVSLSFAAQGSNTAPALNLEGRDVTLTDQQNTLVIQTADVVVRDIELWRVGVSDCIGEADDSCEKFTTGPILVSLPLDGTIAQTVSITVDPGLYDRVEFDVHKVSNDDPEDAAFRAAHPTFLDTSIRVTGTYNGVAFSFDTDLNESQRFELPEALEITAEITSTNVTVLLDIEGWFRDGAGDLVDPVTANKGGINENLVKDNIRGAVEAFEDRNRDGVRG